MLTLSVFKLKTSKLRRYLSVIWLLRIQTKNLTSLNFSHDFYDTKTIQLHY